jgi:hypothetical protein
MGGVAESDTLLWQLGVAWSLFDIVIAGLTEEDALRPPATGAWSVRRGEDGEWRADWADSDPDPVPPTTVAWLLWHIGWWWSDVTGRAFGDGAVQRDEAPWPGSAVAAIERVQDCHARWGAGLAAASAADLASTSLGDRCWRLTGLPFRHVAAWVNVELMKNTAEIGATRRILNAI